MTFLVFYTAVAYAVFMVSMSVFAFSRRGRSHVALLSMRRGRVATLCMVLVACTFLGAFWPIVLTMQAMRRSQ